MISIDGNKTFAQLAVEGKDGKYSFLEKETEPISEYMLKQLGIDIAKLKDTEKNLLLKNFVHLMCNVLSDIKLVNNRLIQYQEKYDKCKNNKSNVAEYYRRKIEHFCKINKEALTEIMDFLQNRIGNYIMENRFDTLAREENGENLSTFFLKRRYKIAQFPEYFDLDYNYATIVKVNYLPDIDFMDKMNVEKEFLSLYQTDKEQYYQKLHKEVDDKKIMDWNLARVENNYHLNKRTEIFQDLAQLFYNKHYQSFLSLGLLQLEGLFYDICQIKYGIKDNMGTLVEKVQKSLSTRNEFSFMRFYPYFAFDVPIQRNEIAHKGMMEEVDLEKAAYDLVLDLNAVLTMVKEESYDKFIVLIMIHEKLAELESEDPDSDAFKSYVNRTFITELIKNSIIANEYFWSVLKNPDDYKEELDFYEPEQLKDGYIDLKGIVAVLSTMIREKAFWREMINILNEYKASDGSIPKQLYGIAKRLKNDYIAVLTDEAKNYCIEVAKLLK